MVAGARTGVPSVPLEPRILAEQVRLLYVRAPIAQAMVAVNACLVCWTFWHLVPPLLSIAWVAALCALAALRMMLLRAYRRSVLRDSNARVWAQRFAMRAALTGVAWGAAAFVFYLPQSPAHQVFLAFVLGGMTAGAASSNASYTPAFVAFAVPAMLPMVGRLAAERDPLHAAMASMLALFGLAVTEISRRGRVAIDQAIRLRFRNEALVEDLTLAQDRLANINMDLKGRVSERTREIERMLELRSASEERLAVTLRSIGDAVIATDGAGNVTLFNGVAEALTGWNAEEALARPLHHVLRVIDEGTRRPVEHSLERVLGTEGIGAGLGNRTLLARNGSERPVAETAAPIRDANGSIMGIVLVLRDQTKERRAEEMLRESEQRLRALADSMSPLAWTARPDGYVTWYNHRWYEYTGTRFEQVKGWGWQTVHDPATLPSVLRRWAESITAGTTFDMQFPLRGADGTFRHFLTRAIPLRTPGGDVAQWFGTHTDVTELVQAQEALHESDRRKDQFIAVLSHELRNPLAPIRNSLYVLDRAGPSSEKGALALAIVRRQIGHLNRLVDDLLDVTRIARGKIELRRQCLDVSDVMRRACDDHRGVLHELGLQLRVEASDPVWVDGDDTRISQVIGNLLHNAAKFSAAGGTVVASAGVVDGQAQIRVRDDGRGIPAEFLPRIFEPFVQGDGDLARNKGGLGLGLALARGLVELHGGSVRAHSDGAGRGSEFVVNLPVAASAQTVCAPT